ncbi:hypothetical protein [Streptomyces sp. x-80]|uniref:hypothetical protein n=1 Tax=Streptomyces sp. x-80 TaxID=2789282 RepID=UPI00397EC218
MGEFALSRDTFRYLPADFAEPLPRAVAGLAQVTVGPDGGRAGTHGVCRRPPGTSDNGPRGLRTAAGYRDDVAGLGAVQPWQY